MKDFFDIWLLSRQFDFDGETLALAIEMTFTRRDTTLSAAPVALRGAFAADPMKIAQWNAFRRTSRFDVAPSKLKRGDYSSHILSSSNRFGDPSEPDVWSRLERAEAVESTQ